MDSSLSRKCLLSWSRTDPLASGLVLIQVYGLEFQEGSAGDYSVYESWEKTPEQLVEMITFSGVRNLQLCELSDGSA